MLLKKQLLAMHGSFLGTSLDKDQNAAITRAHVLFKLENHLKSPSCCFQLPFLESSANSAA